MIFGISNKIIIFSFFLGCSAVAMERKSASDNDIIAQLMAQYTQSKQSAESYAKKLLSTCVIKSQIACYRNCFSFINEFKLLDKTTSSQQFESYIGDFCKVLMTHENPPRLKFYIAGYLRYVEGSVIEDQLKLYNKTNNNQ